MWGHGKTCRCGMWHLSNNTINKFDELSTMEKTQLSTKVILDGRIL